MPIAYAKHFKPKETPQFEPVREDQVKNSAGGFVWSVDDWTRLDRFLILGTEGGTYYASEQKITRDNAKSIVALIKQDGERVVTCVTEISNAGRAYKNDAALFVLALCFAEGDVGTKSAARLALPKVARIGSHLFTFLEYVQSLRGWGRGLKTAVAEWYEQKSADDLALQLVKYKERNGWSHRDALRLSHAKTRDDAKNWLYRYAVGKVTEFADAPAFIAACENVKTAKARDVAEYVRTYNLPREVLPTEALTNPLVWEALLEHMPMTAMIRNLATMTRIEALKPMSKWTGEVADRLLDKERLRKARVHPIQLLAALITYASGHGARGQNTWTPIQSISDALDKSFYLSFDAVVPTGKRIMLAVDVSGSMGSGTICGVPGLTPRHGAAAMALTIANTESKYAIFGFGTRFDPLSISPRMRLDTAMQNMNLPFQGTDCALPMLHALREKMEIDAFIVITDSETWAGQVHPKQALDTYRERTKIPAKLVVVGMVSNGFTIADPNDRGMLDVVGFSTDTPAIIADFIKE
jgi:60 kDa SS-A/Ro ribonucleoprotein